MIMIPDIFHENQMELEQIEAEWTVDCEIDKTKLVDESLKIDQLKTKYRKLMSRQALRLVRMEAELKILFLDKYEHYTQGGSKEALAKGWKLPPVGKVLKNEVEKYMEADKDLIE